MSIVEYINLIYENFIKQLKYIRNLYNAYLGTSITADDVRNELDVLIRKYEEKEEESEK